MTQWSNEQVESFQTFLYEKGLGEVPDWLKKYSNFVKQTKEFFLEWMATPGYPTPLTKNAAKDIKTAKEQFYIFRDNYKNNPNFNNELKQKYIENVKNKQLIETKQDHKIIEKQLEDAKKEIAHLKNVVGNAKSRINQYKKIEILYEQQKTELEFFKQLVSSKLSQTNQLF